MLSESDAAFDAIDTDSSGTIEDYELLLHLVQKGHDATRIDALFRSLDVNADGHISRDEWNHGFEQFREMERDAAAAAAAAAAVEKVKAAAEVARRDDFRELAVFGNAQPSSEVGEEDDLAAHARVAQAKEREEQSSLERHTKFAEDTFTLAYTNLSTFFTGLEGLIGAPSPNLRVAMRTEHCLSDDSTKQFTTGNYGISTTPQIEWYVVVDPRAGLAELKLAAFPAETVAMEEAHKRGARLKPLSELLGALAEKNEALRRLGEPPLLEEELIGGRLYTGPMVTVRALEQVAAAPARCTQRRARALLCAVPEVQPGVPRVDRRGARLPQGQLCARVQGEQVHDDVSRVAPPSSPRPTLPLARAPRPAPRRCPVASGCTCSTRPWSSSPSSRARRRSTAAPRTACCPSPSGRRTSRACAAASTRRSCRRRATAASRSATRRARRR